MSRDHYRGGSTLVGFGCTKKSKSRSGGIGDDTAAIDQKRHKKEAKRRREKAREIENNVRLAKQLYPKRDQEEVQDSTTRMNDKKAGKGPKPQPRTAEDNVAKGAQLALALTLAFDKRDDAEK